jgi:hypothetical protein
MNSRHTCWFPLVWHGQPEPRASQTTQETRRGSRTTAMETRGATNNKDGARRGRGHRTARDDDEDTGRDGGNTVTGFPQLLCLQLASAQIVIVIAVSNTQAELL